LIYLGLGLAAQCTYVSIRINPVQAAAVFAPVRDMDRKVGKKIKGTECLFLLPLCRVFVNNFILFGQIGESVKRDRTLNEIGHDPLHDLMIISLDRLSTMDIEA
jgi:hypothetical protein